MKNYLDHTYAVILAGGGGTRLWPKSRNKTPKQFLKLTGNKTMLQLSALRINQLVPWSKIIVVTNKKYQEEILQELPSLPKENIVLEPQKRDTALAMLAGAKYAKLFDDQAIILNAAADHVVENEKEFVKVMKVAAELALQKSHILTVGITPNYPTTGFGYIKIGEKFKALKNGVGIFKVSNFTEKPDKVTAQSFIKTGKYFWNANMYVWSAETLVQAFKKHKPSMYQLTAGLDRVSKTQFKKLLPAIYSQAESISIDYAISEKADNLLLIPGDFGWNDIGEWQVVYDLGKKDQKNNVLIGERVQDKTLLLDSQNNLIQTDKKLISLLGVNEMIIVDTPEILFIAPKKKSQEVKKVVEELKKQKLDKYL